MDAYTTCHEVLSQLGEKIPQSLDTKETNKMIEETSKTVSRITDTDLLEMEEMDEKLCTTLKFYGLMVMVAYFARPDMFAFLACQCVKFTMKHGICNYSIIGFVQFATVLCSNKVTKDITGAARVGKAAISCLKTRFHSSIEQLPKLYFSYYGLVAFHVEPLQSCADMIRQGFDVGLSIGDSTTAFFCAIQHIKISLMSGEKLFTLLERVDYYLVLADQYKNELGNVYLSIFRDTISTLIDKGETTGSKNKSSSETNENAMKQVNSSEAMYFHRAIQSYWMGHHERCHHYVLKFLQISDTTKLSDIIITFIHGLNSFQMLKRQNTAKLRAIPRNAIMSLKAATSHSRWNFRNKVSLYH